MLEPDIVDLGRGHRHRGAALYALDLGDEVLDRSVGVEIRACQRCDRLLAVDRLVADDDAVDVAIALGERDRAFDLALVLLLPIVDPDALGDAQAEFRRERGNLLEAVRRAIGPDVLRVGRDGREIILDLRLRHRRRRASVGTDRREGNARQPPADSEAIRCSCNMSHAEAWSAVASATTTATRALRIVFEISVQKSACPPPLAAAPQETFRSSP